MSWKSAGQLISGPPSSSLPSTSSEPIYKRIKPNSNGITVYQKESSFVKHYGIDKDALTREEKKRKSDWDVIKENHRFIREEEEDLNEISWEEKVARIYESKLFKEFALIDLKHHKSKAFALRWRTATEVINEIGENTCASLRCKFHNPLLINNQDKEISSKDLRFIEDSKSINSNYPSSSINTHEQQEEISIPPLRSFELPFVYNENNQRKEALVKVKLCKKCENKLKWKPNDNQDEDQIKEKRKSIKEEEGTTKYKNRDTDKYINQSHSRSKSRSPSRRRNDESHKDRHSRYHESSRTHN
ncbi:uncharacterized protein I206_102282 [Kwoniella pini CBS 10737]|uniref:Protein FRA10AC1 n=1 Tax=Kwoniella pini CBS 10737 TaxID=1296096 RepID=A0A1B9HT20_9TREE|nr:uncharacterized protein I206_07652 [Kwoniella pini CBS 10737]OCF46418.1 hypothetical protein I206_07652 [Kwoniella pini CBS 10737]